MNYLQHAYNQGAHIFCNSAVKNFTRSRKISDLTKEPCWEITVQKTGENKAGENAAKHKKITADILILAAGTLGSTELMLRAKRSGLDCSNKLGEHFSGNGDVLGFSYNSYWQDNYQTKDASLYELGIERFETINSIGIGDNEPEGKHWPGPCITGVIDLRGFSESVDDDLIIEEGVAPGAFASLMPAAFLFAAAEQSNFMRYGQEQAELRLRDVQSLGDAMLAGTDSLQQWSYKGPVGRTQSFLVMSMDSSKGRLKLAEGSDSVVIDWPGVGGERTYQRDNKWLHDAADAIQGQFIPNPLSGEPMGKKVITVHPVGGCRMADSHYLGVVNSEGQVFNPNTDGVYQGLYINDGAILPGAVGVNPLLTISALAERNCEKLMARYGWKVDRSLSSSPDVIDRGESSHEQTADPGSGFSKGDKMPVAASFVTLGASAYMAKLISDKNESPYSTEEERKLWDLFFENSKTIFDVFENDYRTNFFFKEKMSGYIDAYYPDSKKPYERISDNYLNAYQRGRSKNQRIELKLAVNAKDIVALTKNRNYHCDISDGEILLENAPFAWAANGVGKVIEGVFQLLCVDQDRVETWCMVYDISVQTEAKIEGRKQPRNYRIKGKKFLHSQAGSSWWQDLTEVQLAFYDNENKDAVDSLSQPIAAGIAKLNLQDFLHQLASFEAKLPIKPSIEKLLKIFPPIRRIKEFYEQSPGQFYMAKLATELGMIGFRAYGGLLSTLKNFPKEELLTLVRRKINAPEPMVFREPTDDGFTIHLTRYQGESTLPPIILAPGMGVNASSFAADTVDTNLIEYLTWHQHQGQALERDVWLFDYRASFNSGSSKRKFSIDDIAQFDWPRAIEKVLKESGHSQVQIIAHCVGSMSLLMSLLAGHVNRENIASIISSQLTLHPVSNWLNNAKSDLDVIERLEELPLLQQQDNVISMNSGNTEFDLQLDVLASMMPVPPGEECNNPTCKRIFASYGPSYLHSQLNHATHIALSEWFKDISIEPFKQMAKIIAAGYVVDADGNNCYLNVVDSDCSDLGLSVPQLNLPIVFIAGALNLEFLPQTSQRTYDWLCHHNKSVCDQYHRYVFSEYGHMDTFIGKNAYKDIFPKLVEFLAIGLKSKEIKQLAAESGQPEELTT